MVPDQNEELLLGKRDASLSDHVGLLQVSQRDVSTHDERLARHSLGELDGVSAEVDVFAAFVLQHRLLHELERRKQEYYKLCLRTQTIIVIR